MSEMKNYFWGIGNIGEGVVSMVTSTYFMIYLTDTALLPLGLVSLISLIGSILDFLLVPVSGALLISTKPMKWGKYRSWLLLCPPFVVAFYILCFTVVTDSMLLTAMCALLGYVGGKVTWNIVYAANVSLTALLSRGVNTGTKMTSQRMIGSNIGRLLGNSLTPALVAAIAVRSGEGNGYRFTILIMGAVYIVTSLIHFAIAGSQTPPYPLEEEQKQRMRLGEILRILSVEPKLLLTLSIDLTSNVASLVLPSLAVYYYKYCAGSPAMVSTHMLVIGFGGLAGAFLVRVLGSHVKKTKSVLLLLYALVAAALLSIRLFPSSTLYFIVIGAFVATFTGMTSPFELTLYIDHAEHYRCKTGQDATGFIMSLSNLPVKFASIIKSALIPFALLVAGYVANAEATPEMQHAIVNAYTLIPASFPIFGIILLGFFYNSKEKPQVAEP